MHSQLRNKPNCLIQGGSVAQLNRASDYGSEGCRFESCRSHNVSPKGLHKKLNLRKRMLFVNILFFCMHLLHTLLHSVCTISKNDRCLPVYHSIQTTWLETCRVARCRILGYGHQSSVYEAYWLCCSSCHDILPVREVRQGKVRESEQKKKHG